MGLFDSIISSVMSSQGGNNSPIGGVLSNLLQGEGQAQQGSGQGMSGGLGGIVSSFEQAGLGHIVQSWIGTGDNHPVSPDQLQQVMGNDQVQNMASQAGMEPHDFLSQLSQHLPNAVHAATPEGQLPQGSEWV
jgi:uncharacterized protein YidB (DUF937 family)